MMTSQVLRKLEARGLIARHVDRTDTRAKQLSVNQAGRALLAGALADVEAADESYFAALGPRREAFLGALLTLDDR